MLTWQEKICTLGEYTGDYRLTIVVTVIVFVALLYRIIEEPVIISDELMMCLYFCKYYFRWFLLFFTWIKVVNILPPRDEI